MITRETIEKLAVQYQATAFPTIVREYVQHVFLAKLYQVPGAEKLLFKGGTALRIVYGSPRFSEDLDFTLIETLPHAVKRTVEDMFLRALTDIERMGVYVELSNDSNETSGGYFGVFLFHLFDYPPIGVEINISVRASGEEKGEVDNIASDFVPTYNLVHMSQRSLVEEKIFGALLHRKKPRDFYDLYFMMRKNMLLPEQKKRLAACKIDIITEAHKIDFRGELSTFLPADHQGIIHDFSRVLTGEMDRQLASLE